MNILEGNKFSRYDDDISQRLHHVQSYTQKIFHNSSFSDYLSHLSLGDLKLGEFRLDFSYLDRNIHSILHDYQSFFIVFHCPFVGDILPGNFYMPQMIQRSISRDRLIAKGAQLRNKFQSEKALTVLITTSKWYFDNYSSLFNVPHLVPVFLDCSITKPMYFRHLAYIKVFEYLLALSHTVDSRKVCVFHDSDLLQIGSWNELFDFAIKSSSELFFTYRWAPNLLPINGGLFLARLSNSSLEVLRASIGLYEFFSVDEFIKVLYNSDIKIWDGDQIVLNSLCQWSSAPFFSWRMPHSNIQSSIIPASIFNKQLREFSRAEVLNVQKDKVLGIHLKGRTKENLDFRALDRFIAATKSNN